MSKVQMLRSVVNQRLTAAAQEIFGLFERTISEYEEELSASKEENERQRRLLDAVFNPEVRIQRADVQQLLVVQEEVPPEQQVWSSSLDQEDPELPHIKEDQEDPEPPHIKYDQEDPEPPHIKEEQEELWISQEGEQLKGLEEVDQMETEADGVDCGGPEPDGKSDPERHTGPDTDETEYSIDREETQEPQSDLKPMQNNEVPVSDVNCSTGNTSISSPECAGSFDNNGHLEKHSEFKTRVKPFKCSVCDKRFGFHYGLKRHMIGHTGEKSFSCSLCSKAFSHKRQLNTHMTVHTREKPFSCSVCSKTFAHRQTLKRHLTGHTGEKPFSCSMCRKTFSQKRYLKDHLTTHTGEKPFSCSVCSKTFSQNAHLYIHMIAHTGEKLFSCAVCGKTFTQKQSMKRHLIVHSRETN